MLEDVSVERGTVSSLYLSRAGDISPLGRWFQNLYLNGSLKIFHEVPEIPVVPDPGILEAKVLKDLQNHCNCTAALLGLPLLYMCGIKWYVVIK